MGGMQLLADALDLVHRLPLAWAKVQALAVAPWQARKLAQATHHLSLAAATYVDHALGDRLGTCGWRTIESAIDYAEAKFHPELLAERERVGKRAWDVTVDHHHGLDWAGTSTLQAVGDTLDLTKFYDLVCDEAAALAALGDTHDLGRRKAKALGVIADRQATLDLLGLHAETNLPPADGLQTKAKTRMYLHLSLTDLLALGTGCPTGSVERLGPATTAKIREWVGHSRVTVVPVLDMARTDAVATHDPPAWMRELVILRDRHCVYPHCERDARKCDLDHITPYDEHGPPGQTNPSNFGSVVSKTPSRQDAFSMAISPPTRRHLRVARTSRPSLARDDCRNLHALRQLTLKRTAVRGQRCAVIDHGRGQPRLRPPQSRRTPQ